MQHRTSTAVIMAFAALVGSWACSSSDDAATSPAAVDVTAAPGASPSASTGDGASSAVDLPSWQTMPVVDVDGVAFTLADYVGSPVLIETFATWCSNCRAQLGDTQQAAAALGDDAAVVALSVETDIDPGTVARYAADNGWTDIRFAVMTPDLLAALADAFGTTVANPPSVPKIVVGADGSAGELTTGPQSADTLVTEVSAAA